MAANTISKMFSIIVLLLLIGVATPAVQPCPSFCRFRLCFRLGSQAITLNDNPFTLLRPAGRLQGPFPCQVTRTGRIYEFRNVVGGEASISPVRSRRPFVPISQFKHVMPSFPPNYFLFGFYDFSQRDSILRLQAHGNQTNVLDSLCVRLPIRSHQILKPNGSVERTIVLSGPRDCIGFRSRIAELDIELRWNSGNDFNIRLIEPSGFQITRKTPVSPTGGRLSRGNSGLVGCIDPTGTDRLRYLTSDTLLSGGYILLIDNINQCSSHTMYRLRVTFKGRTMIDETDVVSRTGSPVVVRAFEIP